MTILDIFIDPFSVPSYLALKPTFELCAELKVMPVWHPFRAPLERRPSKDLDADVRQRHQRVRQEYRDHDYARYAAWQGIPFQRPAPAANRDLIDYALLRVGASPQATAFLKALTRQLWGGQPEPDGQALADLTEIPTLLADFEHNGASALAGQTRQSDPLGIFDAPAFLIDGELFIGRQHLPALRHLLTVGNPFSPQSTT